MNFELGFIGAGNMAEAIARAAIDKGIVPADRIIAADPVDERRKLFAQLGATIADDNAAVIAGSAHVLLAIKPQTLGAIGRELAGLDTDRQIVISIMAGISSAKIESAMGRPARIVRIMPNMPLMVGCGMAAVARGEHAQAGDETLAMKLFGAAGEAIFVDEAALDAVTAVSGSGPAYVFYLAEAMAKAATELGLGEHADLLTRQTILGAATLLAQSTDSPAELRRKVTSPGGTTEAAIKHMDEHRASDIVVNAIGAAERRSKELGT